MAALGVPAWARRWPRRAAMGKPTPVPPGAAPATGCVQPVVPLPSGAAAIPPPHPSPGGFLPRKGAAERVAEPGLARASPAPR